MKFLVLGSVSQGLKILLGEVNVISYLFCFLLYIFLRNWWMFTISDFGSGRRETGEFWRDLEKVFNLDKGIWLLSRQWLDTQIMLNHGLLNKTHLVEFTQNINWKPKPTYLTYSIYQSPQFMWYLFLPIPFKSGQDSLTEIPYYGMSQSTLDGREI